GFALLAALYCLVEAMGKLYFGKAGQLKIGWLPQWNFWSYLAYGPDGQFGITQLPHWIAQAFIKNQYGLPVFANLILVGSAIVFIIAILVYRKRGPVAIVLVLFFAAPIW